MPTLCAAALDAHLHLPPSSFFDVKCDPGFRCVSKIAEFGLAHDGAFKSTKAGQDVDPRLDGAYEWGCPARGAVTASGECKDTGHGTGSFCFSDQRFEAGPDMPCDTASKCLCVRENTPSGDGTKAHRAAEVLDGEELDSGSYSVLPVAHCQECAQHDCSRRECNQCRQCEYTTKVVAGRKTTGCFDLDGGLARSQRQHGSQGRPYLLGAAPFKQDLGVVPHYYLWSNTGSTATFSRKAWSDRYKLAAPSLQRLMDELVRRAKEEWAPTGAQVPAPNAEHLDCFDAKKGGGDNVTGKLEQLLSVQHSCHRMQDLAKRIANGALFEDVADDGTPVNCIKDEDGGGECGALNCYTSDDDLAHAIRALRARSKQCRLAAEYLDEEEERNGPPPADSRERSGAGRVVDRSADEGVKTMQAAFPLKLPLLAACSMAWTQPEATERMQSRRIALREFLAGSGVALARCRAGTSSLPARPSGTSNHDGGTMEERNGM